MEHECSCERDEYEHNHRSKRSKDIDRNREHSSNEHSTMSNTSSGRDRARDSDRGRDRRRDKDSCKDRDRDSEGDRDRACDRDRHENRDRDREDDRHDARGRRNRKLNQDNGRDLYFSRQDYSSPRSSSCQFFRPATYDSRLAQRMQQKSYREDCSKSDERHGDMIRKKQLQVELGLSDEDEQPSSIGDADRKGAFHCRNTFSAHIEELQYELNNARLAERKAQESLSKIQILSMSQTAILKASMSKKIQLKNTLVEDMTNIIKKLEGQLKKAGVTFEPCKVFESEERFSGRLIAAGTSSDNDVEAEFNAIKIEMERLIEENSALKAAAADASSNNIAIFPSNDMVNKAARVSVELKKFQSMLQVNNKQEQLAAAAPSPHSTLLTFDSNSIRLNPEGMQALKSKLLAAETLYLNAPKTIQRLEKKLVTALSSPAAIIEPNDTKDQSSIKVETELQSQLREVETRLTELQVQFNEQKQDSQIKELSAVERYANLKRAAEAELTKIKDQAKQAIVDLKRKLALASKGQQCKQALILNLSMQMKAQRANLMMLMSQFLTQQQQIPVLVKQLIDKMMQRVQMQCSAMASVVDNYQREMKERKRLFNLVQELKGNIRVLCRVRPISKHEIAQGCKMICKFTPEEITLSGDKGRVKTWEFDHVFDMNSMQIQLFSEVKGLVTSILDGYSVCIFAYGQTGSGKTFTMSGSPENPGINTRSLQEIFKRKNERIKEYHDEVTVSVMEIYNEQIRDSLAQDATSTNLQVRQGPIGNFVPGLMVVPVQTLEEVFELIKRGSKNRSTYATDMNEHSSRSHSIISVQLKSLNLVSNVVDKGKLFLVDLAGSERLSKTGAEGQRLKEAQNINKSLSALGDVIAARASRQKHVPYRNSSLTYLLQHALGGDSKTLMVACASPVDYNCEETFCTLNFAARTRSVEMGKATKKVAQAT